MAGGRTGRAKLEIGGKYGRDIIFRGNKKYLPARMRGIIGTYFNSWNTLRDIALYPRLVADLGNAEAGNAFLGTDWEGLNALYELHMQRFSLTFSGKLDDTGRPCFVIQGAQQDIARPLTTVIAQYARDDGTVHDSFDVWRLEKLLRRAKANLKFDPTFGPALRRFGERALSLEESLSFYRQIQAYHAPDFLANELREVLRPAIDEVHTLRQPTELAALADNLGGRGADVRVHQSVEPVVAHYIDLAKVCATPDDKPSVGPDPRVLSVLGDSLKADLYPFQQEGVGFLTVNRRALLADDMGLGKTLQAIAAALYLKRHTGLKRVLIVCPASLKYQWQQEIRRFTSERCEIIGGDKKERESIYHAAGVEGGFIGEDDRPFFYVINYELVYRDIDQLRKLGVDLLVLDEAQRVKNFRTKTAQAVFELPAPYLFVLTGTPLENQLMELYTIMRFIDDSALGKNPLHFRDRYVVLDAFGGIKGYRRIEEVARKIASQTLRRTREQALDQLPPRIEQEVWVELTATQKQIYRELQGQARQLLSDSAWDAVKTNNAMTLLQRLREVCDTPELIDPDQKESQKLSELIARIEDEVGSLDRQVIVFTQWTRMGEIIKRELREAGYPAAFLHGGLKAKERARLVERFQKGDDRIFISTDAGGTGLNLQSASLVVNYDLPFNPAKLNQRIARAHRLGQKQTVFVVNLLCRGTVETKLVKILQEKQNLFDDVFGDISDPDQVRATAGQQRTLRELMRELLG